MSSAPHAAYDAREFAADDHRKQLPQFSLGHLYSKKIARTVLVRATVGLL